MLPAAAYDLPDIAKKIGIELRNRYILGYSPANQLVRRSKTVEINAKSKYLAYFAAWDMLSQTYFSDKKGAWTVVITIDGNFLARKEFAVN